MLRGLTEQQQVQLTEILDVYLKELEQGRVPDRQDLLDEHPELADALELYLDKLEQLYQLADGGGRPLGSDLTGKQLGDYVLEKEIGQGGMGLVFSARQISLDRDVAVKVLPEGAMLDPKSIERFKNEARAAAQLQHPNIVPVYSIGDHRGIHFYAMRRIDGSSLDKRIAEHNLQGTSPPISSALQQFADIARALQTAHEFGIVHRDIKPSNLLLDSNGKLWLTDFGLARVQKGSGLTGRGDLLGTMRYMSPEQAQGKNELVDHRCDVYALGATLYELLTGQQLIQGEDGPGLIPKISAGPAIRLRTLRPEVPGDLQVVLQKALASHRDDRYASALEFGEDLQRVARGEPILARLVSPLVLAGRWMAANSGLVSIVCTTLLLAAAAFGAAIWHFNHQLRQERNLAEDRLRQVDELERNRALVIDQLAFLPGAEQVRFDLIKSQIAYYESFAEQAGGGVSRPDQAEAHSRLARLHDELGEEPAALAAYEEAESIYAKLVSGGIADTKIVVDRFQNLNRYGVALLRAGQPSKSQSMLAEAIASLEARFATHERPEWNLELQMALLQHNRGLALSQLAPPENVTSAEKAFQNSLVLFDKLSDSQPDDSLVQRGHATALQSLGSFLAKQGNEKRLVESEQLLEQALREQIDLANKFDLEVRVSPDLAKTYLSLGDLRLRLQQPEKAATAFQEAIRLNQILTHISPAQPSYQRGLASSLSRLGHAFHRANNSVEAIQRFEQAVGHFRQLVAKFPSSQSLKMELATTLQNLASLHAELGSQTEAQTLLQEATLLQQPTQLQAK